MLINPKGALTIIYWLSTLRALGHLLSYLGVRLGCGRLAFGCFADERHQLLSSAEAGPQRILLMSKNMDRAN